MDRNQREQQLLAAQFEAAWVPLNPTIPVKFENRNFVEPANDIWVFFSVTSGPVADASVGATMARGVGVCYLQIFIPENAGTMLARKLVDDFATVFDHKNFAYAPDGNLWTRRVSVHKTPLRAGWHQWTCECPFIHDQYEVPMFIP